MALPVPTWTVGARPLPLPPKFQSGMPLVSSWMSANFHTPPEWLAPPATTSLPSGSWRKAAFPRPVEIWWMSRRPGAQGASAAGSLAAVPSATDAVSAARRTRWCRMTGEFATESCSLRGRNAR